MRERVAIAGVEANIGIIVLAVFLLFGILGMAGAVLAFATGLMPRDLSTGAAVAFGVAVVVWWARLVIGDLRSVRVVEVGDDGTWTLRGPLGFRRGSIAPGTPITIETHVNQRWIFGVARTYKQVWATIRTADHSWVTSRGPVESATPPVNRLIKLAKT